MFFRNSILLQTQDQLQRTDEVLVLAAIVQTEHYFPKRKLRTLLVVFLTDTIISAPRPYLFEHPGNELSLTTTGLAG